jgi:pimeloyl-ACP methyl ester carboxylesterase
MEWNKDYVREKYKVHMLGQFGIYYPASRAKRLVVVFSSMGLDRYDRYSWFWAKDECWTDTAYLFLKDDSFHYFIGTDEKPATQSFRKIISHFMGVAGVEKDAVFCVGGSMGGYASIYYAALMELNGAIVSNPQLDYKSARAHEFQNWERQIRETGTQWYDLKEFLWKRKMPNVYLEYGNYPADRMAADEFAAQFVKGEGLLILRKTNWCSHTVNGLSKKTIENTILYFENHGFDQENVSNRVVNVRPEDSEGK